MPKVHCYGGPHHTFEREILLRISEVSKKSSHEGRNYVLNLFDHFKYTGPNGDHVCLVCDVLGHNMDFQAAKYEDVKITFEGCKNEYTATSAQARLSPQRVWYHTYRYGIESQVNNWPSVAMPACPSLPIDLKPTHILLELENPNGAISKYLAEVP